MARAFLVVMDSVGIGGAPDADRFFNGTTPDSGANTVGHIAEWCLAHRRKPLEVPVLNGLGLGRALKAASGATVLPDVPLTGRWGTATEISTGKDTPSGHLELAGLPVTWDWTYFPDTVPCFPPDLVQMVSKAAGTTEILGNRRASGTQIIAELGAEHERTGWPICYTSADSVFQVAAHETHFGLARLLDLCAAIAPALHDRKIGRAIARPFVGTPGAYERTGNRKDFAFAPPHPVLTEWVKASGGHVYAIGKIGDIFAMRGIDEVAKGPDRVLMQHLGDHIDAANEGSLTFANFVEFDSLYGHRRDPEGYATHLQWFDQALGTLLPRLRTQDLLVITADHGNDPTWVGTDHTRERVPVLIAGQGIGTLGMIGFCDVARLVARHLNVLEPAETGD